MARLNIIIGSTRPGRNGAQVGTWFADVARAHAGFDVHIADLAEVNLPFLDEPVPAIEGEPYQHLHTRRWSAITAAADAFVIVTLEYQGYPAALKNALDYLYTEWRDKPVAFVSYGMTSGGLRAAAQLKPVVSALGMVPVNAGVVLHLRTALTADGHLAPTAAMQAAAKETLDELVRVTPAFTALRAGQLTTAAT